MATMRASRAFVTATRVRGSKGLDLLELEAVVDGLRVGGMMDQACGIGKGVMDGGEWESKSWFLRRKRIYSWSHDKERSVSSDRGEANRTFAI